MKRFFSLLAVGFAAFALYACGTAPTVKLTPAQFFAIACPPVQQALALAPTFSLTIPAPVLSQVALAQPVVSEFCAAGATVSVASVSQFANTAFPAASAVVDAAPVTVLSADKKAQIEGAIGLAQLAVDTVTDVVQNAQAAAAASGASAAAAPAIPTVPASGTLVALQ
jgi:hypothetical protein